MLWSPSKCWFYRHLPPQLGYAPLRIEPEASCMLNKHLINWAAPQFGALIKYLAFLSITLLICKMGSVLPNQQLYREEGRWWSAPGSVWLLAFCSCHHHHQLIQSSFPQRVNCLQSMDNELVHRVDAGDLCSRAAGMAQPAGGWHKLKCTICLKL